MAAVSSRAHPTPGSDTRILHDPLRRLSQLYGETRTIVALAGYPGSGKTTLCRNWVEAFNRAEGPDTLRVLGMDGFHRTKAELRLMENPEEAFARRGAPYTFNPEAFIASMRELRTPKPGTMVSWPGFEHEKADPEPGAYRVPAECRLIIVEGIYTLMREGPWAELDELFDETWFLDVDLETAMNRIVTRHMKAWGMSAEEARIRADSNDRLNCALIKPGRDLADYLILNPSA